MTRPEDLRWGQPGTPREDSTRDVDDEIAFHVECRVEDNLRRGMTEAEARDEAETRFGRVAKVRRELIVLASRTAVTRRRRDAVLDFFRDVRLAARGLRRRPGFTAIAVLTLALGIGGTTAVFSLTNTLLIQPPAGVTKADSLVRIQFVIHFPNGRDGTAVLPHPYYVDLEHAAPAISSLAGVMHSAVQVSFPGASDPTPRRLWTEMATGNYATTLGLRARIGRLPGPGDATEPRVAAISERLWRDAFDRAPTAVGSTIGLNGATYTVVGVIAGGFRGESLFSDSDLLVPVEAYEDAGTGFLMNARGVSRPLSDRRIQVWNVLIGRLAPGATAELAETQLRAAWTPILEANPIQAGAPRAPVPNPITHPIPTVHSGIGLLYTPGMERVQETMTLLGGVVAFLLLLACANAANLLLVRGHARRGELAVMRAIGAGRSQLVRQLLLEALLLALAGGAAGVAFAFGAFTLFRGERVLEWLPAIETVRLSGTVLLFALVVSLAAAVLSGVLPSLLSVRDLGWISSGASGSQVRTRTSRALLAFQVAVSFVLVVGAGLLLDSLRALRSTHLGVDPESVLEATLDPFTQHYDEARSRELYEGMLAAAGSVPGVSVAALARWPVLATGRAGIGARPEGAGRDDPRAVQAWTNVVSPGFFAAIGLDLVEGRDFRAGEMYPARGISGVAILSAAAAAHVFPEGGAVGRRIDVGGQTPRLLDVVGVTADARMLSVKEGEATWVFEPFGQRPAQWATLYLRGKQGPPAQRDVETTVGRVDRTIPLYDLQPLSRRIDQNLGLERLLARTTGLFATLALLLAGVGIYAVMSTVVHGRTRELGVRVALGADRDSVHSMVLWDGVRVALVGIVFGAVAATQLVGLLQRRLWGVEPLDPTVFLAAAGTLFVAAAAACWAPAWRATRINPVTALRTE